MFETPNNGIFGFETTYYNENSGKTVGLFFNLDKKENYLVL